MDLVPAGQDWGPLLAAALRPVLPDVARRVVDAVAAEVPMYARPLEGVFGLGLRRGVEQALEAFVALLDPSLTHRPGLQLAASESLGRGEVRSGRTLDALLAAYRVGARVFWHDIGALGARIALPAEALVALGEMVFAYIDRLSAASAAGYAQEQSARAGELDRRRSRLSAALVAGADGATLEALAVEAGWVPPAALAAVVTGPTTAERVALALGPGLLPPSGEDPVVLLLADPESAGMPGRLARRVVGVPLALGPSLPWQSASVSARRAVAAYRLVHRGLLGPGLVEADRHLAALVLHADPEHGAALVERALAPLASLPEPARTRMSETLLAWLSLEGARAAVARRLHVHPQTVRYRMTQVRSLFGEALDDPESRFELQLALRLRQAAQAGASARSTTSA